MNEKASLSRLGNDVYVLNSPFVESRRGLIVHDDGSTLIDTSVAFAETQLMLDKADMERHPVRRVILTHSHFDHSAGCQLVPQMERIAQYGAGNWMHSEHARNYLAQRPAEHPDLERVQVTPPTLEIDGSARLRLNQRTLYLFPTPGHSPDSMSILLEPDGVLFSGDAVVTCFPPIIQDGNSTDEIRSLQHILELDYAWLVPGHGPVLDAEAAKRHCEVSLAYLQAATNRLSRFTDPETPIETLRQAVDDLRAMWTLPAEVVEFWHSRAVAKIWDEQCARLR